MGGEGWIGLMSGTSLDGVDAVLALADAKGALQGAGHVHLDFDAGLRAELLALNSRGPDELHRAALATNALMRRYADAVNALLAEFTGIDVACDFRSRDVAAGGQGAPLVPAFHAARFGRAGENLAVLNIGGIANLSLLAADGTVRGFDCGPGNVLMDAWALQHQGQAYDAGGSWAAQGQVLPPLLARMLAEPFLAKPPPKSTGRDLFTATWLQPHLTANPGAEPRDVMATLNEFTALAAVQALQRELPAARRLVVCGGGAFNEHLMRRLAALSGLPVVSSADEGVPPDQVEALAFAWLARALVRREPGNLPAVTGAAGPRVLGALYPAR